MPALNLTPALWDDRRADYADYIAEHVGLLPTGPIVSHILAEVVEAAIEAMPEMWAWLGRLLGSPEVQKRLAELSAKADARWDWEWIGNEKIRAVFEKNDNVLELLGRFMSGYRGVRALIEADVREAERAEGRKLVAQIRALREGASTGAPFARRLSPEQVGAARDRKRAELHQQAADILAERDALAAERDAIAAERDALAARLLLFEEDAEEETPAPAEEIPEEEPTLSAADLPLGLDDEDEEEEPPPAPALEPETPRTLQARRPVQASGKNRYSRSR